MCLAWAADQSLELTGRGVRVGRLDADVIKTGRLAARRISGDVINTEQLWQGFREIPGPAIVPLDISLDLPVTDFDTITITVGWVLLTNGQAVGITIETFEIPTRTVNTGTSRTPPALPEDRALIRSALNIGEGRGDAINTFVWRSADGMRLYLRELDASVSAQRIYLVQGQRDTATKPLGLEVTASGTFSEPLASTYFTWTDQTTTKVSTGTLVFDTPAEALPSTWIEGGGTAYATTFHVNGDGNMVLYLSRDPDDSSTTAGPDFTSAIEGTLTITLVSGTDLVTVTGITESNPADPYFWTPSNAADVAAWVARRSDGDPITVVMSSNSAGLGASVTFTATAPTPVPLPEEWVVGYEEGVTLGRFDINVLTGRISLFTEGTHDASAADPGPELRGPVERQLRIDASIAGRTLTLIDIRDEDGGTEPYIWKPVNVAEAILFGLAAAGQSGTLRLTF